MSHARKFPARNQKTPHWLVEMYTKKSGKNQKVEMVHTFRAQKSPEITGKPHTGSRNGLYVTYTKSPEEIGTIYTEIV